MSLTHDQAVERARELAPRIAARAREAEELRRPHDDTIAELIDAELIEILTPKRWGGHELGLDTHRECVEIISAACVSTGWVYAFYTGHSGVFATRFSERAQAEFFADRPFIMAPATTSPTTRALRVDGGWSVSGRVPWGTGVMHGDWAILSGIGTDNEGSAGQYMFAMPIEDIKVDDVWQMAGMAATGSNDIVLDDVFVPDYRVIGIREAANAEGEGTRALTDPMYHLPLLPFIYCQAVPVFSGALRGAATSFEDIMHRRGRDTEDNRYAHMLLGEARIDAHVAERMVRDLIREVEQHDGRFTIAERALLKGFNAKIVDHVRTAVNNLHHHAGSAANSLDVPLQRIFRDINVLATHAFWDWEISREQVGRTALGFAPTSPLV